MKSSCSTFSDNFGAIAYYLIFLFFFLSKTSEGFSFCVDIMCSMLITKKEEEGI